MAHEDWQRETIWAFTESGNYKHYPGYINVSKCPDGDYALTVRSNESVGTGYIRISAVRFLAMVDALKDEAHRAKK